MKNGGSTSTPQRSEEMTKEEFKPVKNFNFKIENLLEIDRIIEEDETLKHSESA